MKWVALACGHSCWISWLEAFEGREVICPGTFQGGRLHGTPVSIVAVYGQLEVVA